VVYLIPHRSTTDLGLLYKPIISKVGNIFSKTVSIKLSNYIPLDTAGHFLMKDHNI
jgi:hypothetical protein